MLERKTTTVTVNISRVLLSSAGFLCFHGGINWTTAWRTYTTVLCGREPRHTMKHPHKSLFFLFSNLFLSSSHFFSFFFHKKNKKQTSTSSAQTDQLLLRYTKPEHAQPTKHGNKGKNGITGTLVV